MLPVSEVAVAGLTLGTLVVAVLHFGLGRRSHSPTVAEAPHPRLRPDHSDLDGLLEKAKDHASDPLNHQPKAIQPVLFADGHLITQDDIHEAGLCALINSEGRIDSVMKLNGALPPVTYTVAEWVGGQHGARIS